VREQVKREFLRREQRRTRQKVEVAKRLLAQALEEQGRKLWRLKPADEMRLLVLFSWRDKHGLSVLWMLRKLLPIWHQRFSRFRKNASLGCTVAVLVGRKSEEIIQNIAAREFTAGENKRDARERARERIEKMFATERKTAARYKSPMDAPNTDAFLLNYGRELRRWNRSSKSQTSEGSRQLKIIKAMPYRGNPFR